MRWNDLKFLVELFLIVLVFVIMIRGALYLTGGSFGPSNEKKYRCRNCGRGGLAEADAHCPSCGIRFRGS